MRILKVFLLLIIAILIFINGWLYLSWMSLERTFFSSEYLNDIVRETEIVPVVHEELHKTLPALLFQNLPRAISEMINGNSENATEEMEEIAEAKILFRLNLVADVLAQTFNPDWLADQFLLAAEDTLAFTRGEQNTLDLTIDLREKKNEFQLGTIAALEALPEEKLSDLGIKTEEIQLAADRFQSGIALPDTFRPVELLEEAEIPLYMEETLGALNELRVLLLYWPYVFFFLLLIFAMLLAGPQGGLKWFGSATLLFSIPIIACLQLFKLFVSIALTGVTEIVIANQVTVSPELIDSLVNITISRVSIVPLISSALGLIMLTGTVIFEKIREG